MACVKSSYLWDSVISLHLTENMQITKSYQQNPTPENLSRLQTYDVWLKQLGEGILPTIQENIISLDSTMTVPHPDDVIQFVYNNIQEQITNPAYFQ